MREFSHAQFLELLQRRGVEISVKGDGRLQVNAPAGAIDTELRTELAHRKPELVKTFRRAGNPPQSTPLVAREPGARIPQTHAQQGMWLIEHFSPGNVAYNIPEAVLVEDSVDQEMLQVAVDGLLQRHEILRTSFYEDDGELFQSVGDAVSAPIGFTDLSSASQESGDSVLYERIREQARHPFDLSRAPLVRFHLFRLHGQRHAIFFSIHHIIADHISVAILHRELIELYQAALLGKPANLPILTVQYGDYAIWMDRKLASGEMSPHIEYWRRQLAGAPGYIDLPFTRPYPEHRTAWGGNSLVVIPAAAQSAIEELSRRESATTFMVLLAAFAVLIYQRCGQQDFCLGSPFTQRTHVETEQLIGLFVNMLVLRCRPAAELPFRTFLRQVRATALDAYDHSDVPFQELVRILKPDVRSRRSPLFQIMFAFDSEMQHGPSGLIQLDTNPGTAKFDLTLQLRQTPDGISGWFEYCTDIFDAADVDQLASQFVDLLGKLVASPDAAIGEVKLLNAPAFPQDAPPEQAKPPAGRLQAALKRWTRRAR